MLPTPSPSPSIADVADSASTAPWWGVPVIAGVFLLLGASLTFIYNTASERRRQSREDRAEARKQAQRWDDQLRELAASAYTVVMKLEDAADEMRMVEYHADAAAYSEAYQNSDEEHAATIDDVRRDLGSTLMGYGDEGTPRERAVDILARKKVLANQEWKASNAKLDDALTEMWALRSSVVIIAPSAVAEAMERLTMTASRLVNPEQRFRHFNDRVVYFGKMKEEVDEVLARVRAHLGISD